MRRKLQAGIVGVLVLLAWGAAGNRGWCQTERAEEAARRSLAKTGTAEASSDAGEGADATEEPAATNSPESDAGAPGDGAEEASPPAITSAEGGNAEEAGSGEVGAAAPGAAQSAPQGADAGKPLIRKGLDLLGQIVQGRRDEAVEAAEGPLDDSQLKTRSQKQEAVRDFERGRVAESIRTVNELIVLKPYEAAFHFALGLCYRHEKQYKEALKKYQDVLDLGGPKALISLLKAEVFAVEGKKEKVFEMLKEAAIGGRNIITDVHNIPLLQVFQTDTEFIKLALQLERFEVKRGRRFDPFTNPFPAPDKSGKKGAAQDKVAKEDLSPAAQEKLLRDAKNLYERIQLYIKLQDEQKSMEVYGELRAMEDRQQLITIPKIAGEFQLIISRLGEIEHLITGLRLKYYYNQAKAKLQSAKEHFERGEYSSVEKVHGELEQLAREMVSANQRYKRIADQITQASEAWLRRAKIRLAFEAQKPEVQGVVIAGDVRMAILNNRVVHQGESVADFRVVKVESNKVTFRFKGEEIPLVFRRY
jgi:hypothetical protein